MAILSKDNALQQLVCESKELLRNAEYADGYTTCLTQDTEAIELLIDALESPEMVEFGYITEAQLAAIDSRI